MGAGRVVEGLRGRTLVLGDLMLDRYVHGAVERISPEAPVPVVRVHEEEDRPGGAGNVAANLLGLGLEVWVAGWVGEDAPGRRLHRVLEDMGARCDGILGLRNRPTTVKTRVIGGAQQMIRLDVERPQPIGAEEERRLLSWLAEVPVDFDAVVVSDYAKGALGEGRIAGELLSRFRGRGVPVLVDAKGRHLNRYAGATAVTPNRSELAEAARLHEPDLGLLIEAGRALRASLDLDFLVVTLGAEGMVLVDAEETHRLPSRAREVYDVSGAGDTVVATLAAGIAAGLTPREAAALANAAAGVVVGKVGTAPIDGASLREALEAAAPESRVDSTVIGEPR